MRSILNTIFRISHCFFRNQKCTLVYEDHIRAFQKARNVGVPKAPSTPAEIRDQFNNKFQSPQNVFLIICIHQIKLGTIFFGFF